MEGFSSSLSSASKVKPSLNRDANRSLLETCLRCLVPLPAVQHLRQEGETAQDSLQIQVRLKSRFVASPAGTTSMIPSRPWAWQSPLASPNGSGVCEHAPAGPELPSSVSRLQSLHELSMQALGELMRGLLEEDPTESWVMEMFHVSSQAELSFLGKAGMGPRGREEGFLQQGK